MSNQLYQQMNGNNMSDFISQLNKLKNTFKGDPSQAIQEMLNSGKVSQAEYDRAVKQAQELQSILGKR